MKSVKLLGYWIGEVLDDLVDNISDGIHPAIKPAYFNTFASLIVEATRVD